LIQLWLILGLLVLAALVLLFYIKGQRIPVVSGSEEMIGQKGEARTDLNPRGRVFVMGELWRAESRSGDIKQGDAVRVTAVNGLTLTVEKIEKEEK